MPVKKQRPIRSGSSIHHVMKRPEFREHRSTFSILPGAFEPIINRLSFQTLARLAGGAWNCENMADGLNYLSEKTREAPCFYEIWPEEEMSKDPAKRECGLTVFRGEKGGRFVLICPGGAFLGVASLVEGFPVAREFNRAGYTAFVLKYRVGKDASFPHPIEDAAAALRFIFRHAEEFGIDTEGYAVAGFSAGGYVAAGFATEAFGFAQYGLPRPGSVILAYPLITLGEFTHKGCRNELFGKKQAKDKKRMQEYSVEKVLTDNYPPTFVWQCTDDSTVPFQNSKLLVEALDRHNIPCRYETFESDAHGWGVGIGTPAEDWIRRAIGFMEEQGVRP